MTLNNPKVRAILPSLSGICLLLAFMSLTACTNAPPQTVITAAVHSCDQLRADCRALCSDATDCKYDCDTICTQAIDATHCQYDDSDHSCMAVPCNDGSCASVGSTQPNYSDCLAHCASTQSASGPNPAVRSILTDLCSQSQSGCRGGDVEDTKQCTYVPASGECHAVSCPAGAGCSSVGSTQPSQGACYAHCAANE